MPKFIKNLLLVVGLFTLLLKIIESFTVETKETETRVAFAYDPDTDEIVDITDELDARLISDTSEDLIAELEELPAPEQHDLVENLIADLHKDDGQPSNSDLTDRQNRILSIIKENNGVTVKDINKRIKKVSARTLRRDIGILEKQGLVSQMDSASKRGVKYI